MHCLKHDLSAPGMSVCPDCEAERRANEDAQLQTRLAEIDVGLGAFTSSIEAQKANRDALEKMGAPGVVVDHMEEALLALSIARRHCSTWRALTASAKVKR